MAEVSRSNIKSCLQAYMLTELHVKISKLCNKRRFLLGIIKGEIEYHNRGKAELIEVVERMKFFIDKSAGVGKYDYLLDNGDTYTNSTKLLEEIEKDLAKLQTEKNELRASVENLCRRDIISLD